MSIATQITRLRNIKTAIRNALIEKGIVADNHNMEDFAQDILDITSGIDISDTTATASDVLLGKIFYDADGAKTEGNIKSKSDSGLVTLTPTTFGTWKEFSAGYYPNSHGVELDPVAELRATSGGFPIEADRVYKAVTDGYAIDNYKVINPVQTGKKVGAGFFKTANGGYFYLGKQPTIRESTFAASASGQFGAIIGFKPDVLLILTYKTSGAFGISYYYNSNLYSDQFVYGPSDGGSSLKKLGTTTAYYLYSIDSTGFTINKYSTASWAGQGKYLAIQF